MEGIEYSKELVKLVRERNPTLPVRWADALQIDRPDNHYDSYISIGVVEHRSEGPEPFLAEAFRVLRPGGRLLISVPFFGFTRRLKSAAGLFGGSPQGRFFQYGFGLQEFVSMVALHGFDIRSTHRLYAHRLLLEECSLYRWLSFQRGARFVRKLAEAFIGERDGHMLMVLAQKPARDDRQ